MSSKNDSSLPYVYLPGTQIKILIDSGSTRSFISPSIAKKYYPKLITDDPFEIRTAHGSSKEKYSVTIPTPRIFNTPNKKLKFYVFDFHDKFQMLLGLDNLKTLECQLDFKNNKLTTPSTQINLNYRNSDKKLQTYLIEANTEKIIEIKIKNLQNGDALLKPQNFNDLTIPECLIKVTDSKAQCIIKNNTKTDKKLTITEPFIVEKLTDYIIPKSNNPNLNMFNHKKLKFDTRLIRTDHMNTEERNAIINLIKSYSDIFHLENQPLSFTNQIKHTIRTTDEIPIYTKSYRYPQVYKQEVQNQIEDMLKQNIIQHSTSPWTSPVWVVPKKNDNSGKRKFRVVIDFRLVNKKTIDDKFPIPNITDILDKLGKSQYFSCIDLASGFHQIEMDPASVQKTAFSTETGHYEFLRMPFGLKNAPATFQRVMNHILKGITSCAVYLDDIIIFSTSLQEHINTLKIVFNRLRQYNLKIQLDKTNFLKKETEFLGHIITPDGVKPNPDKIKAIQNYPIPKTTKEIKAFLGLLGYYRKFIQDFAKLTKPLTKRLKKGQKIDITEKDYVECFKLCKTLLTNEPILKYPDFTRDFILTTDASNFAIGAILSQTYGHSDLPVAYASRTLNETETHLSTIEKELLAIVWATKYFRPYLYGRKFKIYSDHRPLQWLFSLKEPNSKLLRWRLKLEEFDYEIIYKKGKQNTNADALSRIDLNANETVSPQPGPSNAIESETLQETINKILEGINVINQNFGNTNNEDTQSLIVNLDDNDTPSSDDVTVHTNAEGNDVVTIPITDTPLNIGKNQVIIQLVNHTPSDPRIIELFDDKQRTIVQLSKNNFEHDTIKFIREMIVPKMKYYIYFETDVYEHFCNIVMRNFKNSEINLVKTNTKLIDVLSEDEIKDIIDRHHISKTNHRGIDETYNKIRTIYYWPNQRKSIQTFINQCDVCLKTKYERAPLKVPLNLTPTPTKPLQTLHIDSITLDNSKFLTLIDPFSKYAQAYKLRTSQATEIVSKLIQFFIQHGTPDTIISDNGLEFNNGLIRELLNLHRIKIHYISSQHPESNGPIERFHSTLVEHIRLFNNQEEFRNESIEMKLNYAILAYNSTVHSITKLKPFDIIYGHLNPTDPLDIDLEAQILNDYVQKHKDKTKKIYEIVKDRTIHAKEKYIDNRNRNTELINIDDSSPQTVYVHNKQKQSKLKNKYKPEKLIAVDTERNTGQIEPQHHNTQTKIHISNIKRPRKKTYKFKKP